MKEIDVVAAVIKHNDKILCVQRGVNKYSYISKKYEFPGGKIETGETKKEAIIREIKEELKMEIVPTSFFYKVKHHYPDFILNMESFICSCNVPDLELTEHIDFKWLSISELANLDWAAADVPIVNKLIESYG